MKNSILLALAAALLVAFTFGCKTAPPKTTPLPSLTAPGGSDTTGAGTRTTPNLDTPGMPGGAGVTGGTGAGITVPTDLPDEAKLDGRDQDRARFSAETVLFDFDRSNVKAADAPKVDKVAAAFKALPPGYDLLIEGHCDERGTEGYNQSLGERRALEIRQLLTGSGIDGQHVFTKSFGKDRPVDPGHMESAWSKNRRGEFILVLPKKIGTTH